MTTPPTPEWVYGRVDPLAAEPRYTTVADVKEVLGIPDTDTTKDARITEAIVAGEYSIDAELGRSFPDPGTQVLATAAWNASRPSNFILPPAAGELNIDSTATLLEMSKTDADAQDQSAWTPDPTEIMILDFPIIQADVWLEIVESTDETTYWAISVRQFNDTIVPNEMDSLRTEVSAVSQQAGGVGKVQGIPLAVSSVARAVGVSIYKSSEAPFGTAGSDDFLGTVSVPQIVAEEVRRNPQLHGFKVSFGVR